MNLVESPIKETLVASSLTRALASTITSALWYLSYVLLLLLWSLLFRLILITANRRIYLLLELDPIQNCLFLLLSISLNSLPGIGLILQAKEIFLFHAADLASQWGALDCRPVVWLLEDHIFVPDDVTSLIFEKLYRINQII
jgi:hypothetical protein